ncbi:MAG: YncE family protein [Actinomycetota bacterium]|nr:YncE family protein [Actinomycetota bacterium]
MRVRSWRHVVPVALALALAAACGGRPSSSPVAQHGSTNDPLWSAAKHIPLVPPQFRHPLPGMPRVVGNDIYSQTRAGMFSPKVLGDPAYLYVPDSTGTRVTVIDQRTRKIVRVIQVGYLSQHVVPSYDLRRLVVNSSAANTLEVLDPRTGRETRSIQVPRPYNLYYTPDGKSAIVMVEQYNTIRFSTPQTFRRIADVQPRGCSGPNHADFSANGRFFVVTCEFSGELVKIGTLSHKVLGVLKLDARPTAKHASPDVTGMSMPQDIRLSPDGRTFYVADMGTNELRLVDARTLRQRGVIGMPSHPHGLYPSRDGKLLYISDRGAGEVSVLDFASNKIVATWVVPGGGSPDMGGVSADGKMLWLSGRYDGVVYGFNTVTGKLVARILVGGNPHGLAVWPQPGRYSLGHTGNMR